MRALRRVPTGQWRLAANGMHLAATRTDDHSWAKRASLLVCLCYSKHFEVRWSSNGTRCLESRYRFVLWRGWRSKPGVCGCLSWPPRALAVVAEMVLEAIEMLVDCL